MYVCFIITVMLVLSVRYKQCKKKNSGFFLIESGLDWEVWVNFSLTNHAPLFDTNV